MPIEGQPGEDVGPPLEDDPVPDDRQREVGENSCPYAVATRELKVRKPTNTNQCMTPIGLHCSIRVWPNVSASMVRQRAPGLVRAADGRAPEPDDRQHLPHGPHGQHDRHRR